MEGHRMMTAGAAIRDAIEHKRALLRPTTVKVGRIPKWVRRRDLFSGVNTCGNLLDHYGLAAWPYAGRKREMFVIEPYPYIGIVKDLAAIEDHYNIETHIDSNSWHFPGWTVRVWFTEDGWE